MDINKHATFSVINQWDEEWSRYCCTFFANAINLKYNCGIDIEEDELKWIAEEQFKKGKFDYKFWGWLVDGANALYDYIKDTNPVKLTKFYKWDKLFDEYLNAWYALSVGISVNKEFTKDAVDGKIETYKDYAKYKGKKLRHNCNIIKWIGRWDTSITPVEYILDSYAFNKKNREWLYECDVNELREDLLMNTVQVFTLI